MAYLKHLARISAVIGISLVITLIINAAQNPAVAALSNQSNFNENFLHAAPLANSPSIKSTPQLLATYYSNQLDRTGIKLHPGSEHRSDSKPTKITTLHCKSIVYETLMTLPANNRAQLHDLTLFYTPDGRRGLGGNGGIILRCLNETDEELASVLAHEMGHIVDASLLKGRDGSGLSGFYDFSTPVPADDPSVIFYRYDWNSEKQMNTDADQLDFVSQYAMTDPFEDFAETYAYYRFHGRDFRTLAQYNSVLTSKYNFMKFYVFGGQEYGTEVSDSVSIVDPWSRNYDVTVLPIN